LTKAFEKAYTKRMKSYVSRATGKNVYEIGRHSEKRPDGSRYTMIDLSDGSSFNQDYILEFFTEVYNPK